MALFRAYTPKIVPASVKKSELSKDFYPNTNTLIYHHPNPTNVTKDECPCKEIVRAHTSDVGGQWYGCVFCGFTVFAEISRIEVSSNPTVTTYA